MTEFDYRDPKTRSGDDLVAWFREVTEEIDDTPGRLRSLALRRRELARGLAQTYGPAEAAALCGVSQQTLEELAAPVRQEEVAS